MCLTYSAVTERLNFTPKFDTQALPLGLCLMLSVAFLAVKLYAILTIVPESIFSISSVKIFYRNKRFTLTTKLLNVLLKRDTLHAKHHMLMVTEQLNRSRSSIFIAQSNGILFAISWVLSVSSTSCC